MATVLNNWVTYIDRSFQQVKAKLIQRLETAAPEITDHTENNILIVIISMFAGVAEMLNYYIDNMAREAFIETARKYSSMVNLVRILDYRIKASVPETVDLKFTLSGPAPVGGATIPTGTEVTGPGLGYSFLTTENITIPETQTQGIGPAKQISQLNAQNIGTTDGTQRQQVSLGINYVEESASLDIGGEIYILQPTFAFSGPDDPHFIVEIDATQTAFATLGDGVRGKIPTASQTILADYRETFGADGLVAVGELDTIVNPPTLPGGLTVTVINEIASSGGTGVQSLEEIRREAPLFVRTLDRAVTYQDYKDIAILQQGVEKAEVSFCCGKTVEIFIAPEAGPEGGIATEALLTDTKNFFEDKRMVTTVVEPRPAGVSNIVLSMTVAPKFRRDPVVTLQNVQDALLNNYNYNEQDINSNVRISDILALVDNLEKVDFANIETIYLLPYARPEDHTLALDWTRDVLVTNTETAKYKLAISTTGAVAVFRDNAFLQVVAIGTQYSDDLVQFTVNSSAFYVAGMEWTFMVYPAGQDIEVDDFSVPTLISTNLTLGLDTSSQNSNTCKPDC